MRRIAHLSDLHFGHHDDAVADALLAELAALQPEVVAISGDLTQRARRAEFAAARTFLERIDSPLVVVPGNHDVPLFDLYRRFFRPLHRFRRFITAEEMPSFRDEHMAIIGVNTARSLTWKDGRISFEQIEALRRWFDRVPETVLKVLVAHHPFQRPPQVSSSLVGRGEEALKVLRQSGVDLLLTGHLHTSHSDHLTAHRAAPGRQILVAHAGTAISRRLRKETNSYNWITTTGGCLTLEVRSWDGTRFKAATQSTHPFGTGHPEM